MKVRRPTANAAGPGYDRAKLKDIESIYLQRLDNRGKTNARLNRERFFEDTADVRPPTREQLEK
jgi:hypothetical protein